MKKSQSGISQAEVILAVLCTAIIMLAFTSLLRVWTVWSVKGMSGVRAQMEAQKMASYLERDLFVANEINVASPTAFGFIADISQTPGFNPNGDIDVDGIVNSQDADYDNDISSMPTPGLGWQVGFNLKDDDDDGDGKIDYQFRYYLSSGSLYRDYSVNQEAWGSHVKKMGVNISSVSFTYYGSKSLTLGSKLDVGHDGVASTNDSGENDGIIDQTEIDMTPTPLGGGNANGRLDTAAEFIYITSIRIRIDFDMNKDGKTDFTYSTEISPPMMPVKAMQI